MGVVVDTNVFIDAENGRLKLDELQTFREEPVYLAAVTVSELLTGVHLASDADIRVQRLSFVENILQSVPMLDFDKEVARTYAELYAYALQAGARKNLNVHDLQIAATAICYGYSVLTSNNDDFSRIPGVRMLAP